MGPLRRGLTVALTTPAAAAAEVCADTRPGWKGGPVSAFDEALFLAMTPAALVLILASALAVRFRHQWGALIVVVLWSIFVSFIALGDPTGVRALEIAEGCIGSPALFIAGVAAICGGMIYYTTPRESGTDT
ncbi:MAG: hypothetical protein AAF943_06420 [Pseudomonadota bacterium]